MTCSQMADRMGISKDAVHRILTEKLLKRKIVAKWVPHLLTPEQKQTRIDIVRQHLQRFQQEGDNF